jgi:hypothetical protein
VGKPGGGYVIDGPLPVFIFQDFKVGAEFKEALVGEMTRG